MTEQVLSDDLLVQLRQLMELRQERDELDKASKAAKEDYKNAELDLFELLDAGPMRRLNNVDLGEPWGRVSFGARETTYGSIIKGQQPVALEHFKSRAMFDEMTTPQLNKKRLNEIVRELEEQGADMPPGITYYKQRGVTVTREK